MRDLKEFTDKCKSLLESGSYDDVVRESLERLESLPDDLEALLFMAEARLLKGDIADAKSLLDPVCLRVLQLSRAFKLLGDSYVNDNPGLARDYYGRYIAVDPDSEEAVKLQEQLESDAAHGSDDSLNTGFRTMTMADLMVKQGHIETAREILEEILGREPDNQQALDRIGRVRVIQELEKWRKGLALGKKNEG